MYGFSPIGFVETAETKVPRHWSVSDVKGRLVLDKAYEKGLCDIKPGDRIIVLFVFHKSPAFEENLLVQKPPHKNRPMGVFSICSPIRPNPVGLSVLTVDKVENNVIHVTGIDMFDQTPIIDIKPFITPEPD
jgi:tRNA-Thr(GGU) m(6)t(6)A37 methyltransferase TsaA